MTYSPAQAGVMDGTDYFEQLGLLGDTTGMEPIKYSLTDFPVPDEVLPSHEGYEIKDSVLKIPYVLPNLGLGIYDLGGTKSKVLIHTNILQNISQVPPGIGIGVHDGTTYTLDDPLQDCYETLFHGFTDPGPPLPPGISILRYDGTGPATSDSHNIADCITFYQLAWPVHYQQPVMGIALYVDGTNVTTYTKTGDSQWFEINKVADSTYTSFNKAYLHYHADYARFITPFVIWAAP